MSIETAAELDALALIKTGASFADAAEETGVSVERCMALWREFSPSSDSLWAEIAARKGEQF